MSDIHALSGAYAIDALDDIERAQFARHLAECDECQFEVASVREAATLLAETTAVEPPADLRRRILAEVKTVRPLPPVIAEAAPDPSDDLTDSDEQVEAAVTTPPRDRRWLRGLVAAAAVIATVGAGGVIIDRLGDDSSQSPALSAADRVLQSPDAERVSHTLPNGGEATVVASRSLNKVVVITKDLPALPEGKIYEMWIQDAQDGMLPAGLMTAENATVVLEGDIENAVGAGITVEPAGGSRIPTTKPIALFEFENA
jgi:anti-sigma factor RsiW